VKGKDWLAQNEILPGTPEVALGAAGK
jgi:hypothetical protein